MILQALTSYYQRISKEGKIAIASEGFQKQEIPFIVVLNQRGECAGLQDTRQGDGKKKQARAFTVPRAVKRASGIAANLLWDNTAYILGRPKPDKKKDMKSLRKRSKEQHNAFVEKIREAFPPPIKDAGVAAVVKFLERGDFSKVFAHPLWQEIEETGANLSFQLKGDTQLVCERKAVVTAVTNNNMKNDEDKRATCLVSGELDMPVRLHTAIKGVWGAQTSGANIVSFNLPAFNSFNKEQGYNAPIGKKAEFAYTTALNTLLARGSRQRIQVGDASTVFWAAKPNPLEKWFSEFFGRFDSESAEQNDEAIRALYAAPKTGAPPLSEDLTPFFVLGLSPNAARIAIRFWYAGTVGDVARHIRQHFDDCALAHGPNQPDHLSLFRMLTSTAVQGKAENIQPNLSGAVMKAILADTPYPQTLLASAIRRTRAERELTYPRAAVIKATLARESRFYKKAEKEVTMSLDRSNGNVGYLMGRLFAVLERAQEFANPGINATIRDRFYGAASSTPVAVFPHLMKLKNHHIAKLENKGMAVNMEKQLGEIMGGISDFPAHLSLADQGRFAVGYYHQRQDFFTKKETSD